MISMNPPKVFIHKSVIDNRFAKDRLDKMMSFINTDSIAIVDDNSLAEAIKYNGWLESGGRRTGELKRQNDPFIVFNAFRFLSDEKFFNIHQKYPTLAYYNFSGNGHITFRNKAHYPNGVCKSAYEIHSAWGCYHACDYCHVKDFINIMLNLEEFVEHLDQLVKKESWQKLYKYDNQTDTICFEPEYGASDLLVRYFSQQSDKYLMLYTKSNNVDHLLDLPHNGQTIINWTLSCNTTANEIEKKAPSMDERIESARKCQEAGYTVRFRFSPIIPVKNWQDENRQMIERLFAKVKPDLITMDVLGWMNARQIINSMDISLFDDEYKAVIEKLAEENAVNYVKQIIPHEYRLKIYRFFINELKRISANTPFSICMETPDMWNELRDDIGMNENDYVCCCGPESVPRHPKLAK